MAAHDASSRWRTFLEEAKDSEVMALLSRQSNYPFLAIPFHELQSFDPDFAEDILENPKSKIPCCHPRHNNSAAAETRPSLPGSVVKWSINNEYDIV